jgi:DNA-directed RNA polymerase subunit RPC12/RpoP
MPKNDYICGKCGKEEERKTSMAAIKKQVCSCGYKMVLKPSAPMLHGFDSIGRSRSNK